jgi:hypothetical protein
MLAMRRVIGNKTYSCLMACCSNLFIAYGKASCLILFIMSYILPHSSLILDTKMLNTMLAKRSYRKENLQANCASLPVIMRQMYQVI